MAFYALLVCMSTAAGVFALWNHGRSSAQPRPARGGATALSTTVARVQGETRESGRPHVRARRVRTLSIRASRGRSWIAIRAGSPRGKVIYEGTLEQGAAVEAHGTAFWTQIGAVENVDVRVDRHAVRLGASALSGVLLAARRGKAAPSSQATGVIGS